jgi:hypothetical protein
LVKKLLLFVVVFGTCYARSQSPALPPAHQRALDLRQHPTGNATPVQVSMGLYITDLVDIDETRENFELGGYLIDRWHDPRLEVPATAGDLTAREKTRRFRMEDIWTPPIEAANSVSHKIKSYSIEADRNGNVTLIERFDSVISNTFDLKKFPFDTQVLHIEFEPFLSAVPTIRFSPKALPGTGFRPGGHVEVAAWRVKDIQYATDFLASDGTLPSSREALFEITVQRQSGFYIWKIFLPLAILSLIPMVVFWIDPKEFDWLLKVPMMMLLSTVAFEFAIVRDLPRIGYITFLDAVITTSFAFFFLIMMEITAVFLVQKGEHRPWAVRIHAAGRWAYPAAYIAVIAILALWFFAGK